MVIIKNDDVWEFNDMARKVEKILFIQKTLNWAKWQRNLIDAYFFEKNLLFADESFIVNKKSLYYMYENMNAKFVIVTTIVLFNRPKLSNA